MALTTQNIFQRGVLQTAYGIFFIIVAESHCKVKQ